MGSGNRTLQAECFSFDNRTMGQVSRQQSYLTRHHVMLKAIAIFIATVALFFWVFNNQWLIDHLLDPFTAALASVTAALFRAVGSDASAFGQSIRLSDTTVTVATGCNGTEALSLFCAAVLAFPTRVRQKILGLGIGILGILIVNELRIIGLVIVAVVRPDYLFEAHNYIGQTFVIVMGAAIWVYWAERYATIPNTRTR